MEKDTSRRDALMRKGAHYVGACCWCFVWACMFRNFWARFRRFGEDLLRCPLSLFLRGFCCPSGPSSSDEDDAGEEEDDDDDDDDDEQEEDECVAVGADASGGEEDDDACDEEEDVDGVDEDSWDGAVIAASEDKIAKWGKAHGSGGTDLEGIGDSVSFSVSLRRLQ